jgi:hypothetical protein
MSEIGGAKERASARSMWLRQFARGLVMSYLGIGVVCAILAFAQICSGPSYEVRERLHDSHAWGALGFTVVAWPIMIPAITRSMSRGPQ